MAISEARESGRQCLSVKNLGILVPEVKIRRFGCSAIMSLFRKINKKTEYPAVGERTFRWLSHWDKWDCIRSPDNVGLEYKNL